ncbi:ribokinase [Rothia halotolerans]|uniref:ribokinase n=1 Tax=Rothia halotolerans TaxID=405770 RepID=UPI00192DF77B|nr:ribokinase [Rothia halotolerans]
MNRGEGGVCVVGSVSRDVTVAVRRFPAPGETVVGSSVSYGLGGKGANQAVAAALTGTPTTFLGCVGDDSAGSSLQASLAEHGVGISRLARIPGMDSGSAHITVDAAGENSISIVPAANLSLGREMVAAAAAAGFDGARVVVAQGEIPVETIEATVRAVGRCRRVRMVLNLAPAAEVSGRALGAVDVLVVNESEAAAVLARHAGGTEAGGPVAGGDGSAAAQARALTAIAPAVVVTLGARGSLAAVREAEEVLEIPATPVAEVLDTTGAGDAFVGVLCAALARRLDEAEDPGDEPLGCELLGACARIAGREVGRVVGRRGASSSYTSFSLEEAGDSAG